MADKEKKEIKQPNALARYYRETAGELRKVAWPTWPEAKNLTVIVLIVLVAMAVFLGAIDYIGAKTVDLILGVF